MSLNNEHPCSARSCSASRGGCCTASDGKHRASTPTLPTPQQSLQRCGDQLVSCGWLFAGLAVALLYLFGRARREPHRGPRRARSTSRGPRLFHGQLACFDSPIASDVAARGHGTSAPWTPALGDPRRPVLRAGAGHEAQRWFLPPLLIITPDRHLPICAGLQLPRIPSSSSRWPSSGRSSPRHWPWLWFDTYRTSRTYFGSTCTTPTTTSIPRDELGVCRRTRSAIVRHDALPPPDGDARARPLRLWLYIARRSGGGEPRHPSLGRPPTTLRFRYGAARLAAAGPGARPPWHAVLPERALPLALIAMPRRRSSAGPSTGCPPILSWRCSRGRVSRLVAGGRARARCSAASSRCSWRCGRAEALR